jgi:hypothetical protein
MNLPLERIECEALNPSTLEKKYAKYLKDFTKKEFENEFLLGEEHIEEVFSYLSSFIEQALMSHPPILYAQTTRMLKFYRNQLRRKQETVLFVHMQGELADETKLAELVKTLLKVKERLPLVKILVSDLGEAPGTFSLLEDQ